MSCDDNALSIGGRLQYSLLLLANVHHLRLFARQSAVSGNAEKPRPLATLACFSTTVAEAEC